MEYNVHEWSIMCMALIAKDILMMAGILLCLCYDINMMIHYFLKVFVNALEGR